jgi:hypothetical protein
MVVKQYTRVINDAGRMDKVQTITQASTVTRVLNYGVTVLTNSSANNTFVLDSPVAGLRKDILVDPNSTGEVSVVNRSTATIFFGSTTNSVVFSTGTGVKLLNLVGLSSASWGIVGRSTGLTFAASTVSG